MIMKAKVYFDNGTVPHQEHAIKDFVSKQPTSPRLGVIRKIAILPVGVIDEEVRRFKPYRVFKTVGEKELITLCDFLEGIDFECINFGSGPINGYDVVFCVPEEELTYYDEQLQSDFSNALRDVFQSSNKADKEDAIDRLKAVNKQRNHDNTYNIDGVEFEFMSSDDVDKNNAS
ncbi:hypothetical protein L3V35_12350 [Vibrio sp. L5-1]|uniref:hypothetical protein n=1 Tax=Vibrio sp. L5-1 TaxID=2912254 RepID=UPI001F31E8BC|nr:hypothetical protein [Vibrio sp. L5-1]MCF7495834.1 hypothetical protein [Vibrio sp. L5-1]